MLDVDVVRQSLLAAARERRTVTYDELRSDGLAVTLRALSVESDDHDRGLLTALVVRADTGLPGNGFFRLAAERGRDVTDRRAAWEAELATVYAAHSNDNERGSSSRG